MSKGRSLWAFTFTAAVRRITSRSAGSPEGIRWHHPGRSPLAASYKGVAQVLESFGCRADEQGQLPAAKPWPRNSPALPQSGIGRVNDYLV